MSQKSKKRAQDTYLLVAAVAIILYLVLGLKHFMVGNYRYRFIHIPKTGGTAFNQWIDTQHKQNQCLSVRSTHTHVFGTSSVEIQGYQPITIIRHPIDRFISSFYYWKNGSSDIKKWQRSQEWQIGKTIKDPDEFIQILRNKNHPLHQKVKYSVTHKDQYTQQHHFAPQHSWIQKNSQPIIICYDKAHLAENIQKAFTQHKINCPTEKMPVVNKTKSDQKIKLSTYSIAWLNAIYAEDLKIWHKYCD